MPIHFTSSISIDQPGIHLQFLYNPKWEELQSHLTSLSSKIPNSYRYQLPQKNNAKSHENWSASCSLQSHLFYLPHSILCLAYYPIRRTRCQKNMPSLFEQWSNAVTHFFSLVPNRDVPMYVHIPRVEGEDEIRDGLWNGAMEASGYQDEKGMKEFWKSIECFIVSDEFEVKKKQKVAVSPPPKKRVIRVIKKRGGGGGSASKKDAIAKYMIAGQIALVRKEVQYLVDLTSNIKTTEFLKNHYKNGMKNGWYFPDLCAKSKKMSKLLESYRRGSYRIHILNKEKLKKEKLNLILSVNAGSKMKPYLMMIEYDTLGKGKGKRKIHPKRLKKLRESMKTCMMVGKGVIFDSGGMDLKPGGPNLIEMKNDMTGSAIVYGFTKLLQYMPPSVDQRVVTMIPLVENRMDGASTHSGNKIETRHGMDVMVMNTDAEGRLIMGDAFSYGVELYKPNMVMDVATLTGAAHSFSSGKFSIASVRNIPTMTSEYQKWIQQLKDRKEDILTIPFRDEFLGYMRGTKGEALSVRYDMRANFLQASGFLGNFLPDSTPWFHLDLSQSSYGNYGSNQGHSSMTGIYACVYGWKNWMQHV